MDTEVTATRRPRRKRKRKRKSAKERLAEKFTQKRLEQVFKKDPDLKLQEHHALSLLAGEELRHSQDAISMLFGGFGIYGDQEQILLFRDRCRATGKKMTPHDLAIWMHRYLDYRCQVCGKKKREPCPTYAQPLGKPGKKPERRGPCRSCCSDSCCAEVVPGTVL